MKNPQGLLKVYERAGAGYLACRLERLFTKIETPADIALHNDVLEEFVSMIDGNEKNLYLSIYDFIVHQKVDKKKRFLLKLANLILTLGRKKG